jgi:hypothetical protein
MVSASKRLLKTALFEHMRAKLAEHGFILKAQKDAFIRKADGITDIFLLVCLDAKPGYRIHPDVGVRFELVEQIFHKTSGFEPKYQKDTPTIGGSVGNIMSNDTRPCEFLLESEAGIPVVSEHLVRVFRDFALSYFDKFHSLFAIDAELNDNPTRRTPNRVAPWPRESTGLIVAKLVGRPDYENLAGVYSTVMRDSHKGFYYKTFEALVKSLESIKAGSGLGNPS